jgi:hypothetical protein
MVRRPDAAGVRGARLAEKMRSNTMSYPTTAKPAGLVEEALRAVLNVIDGQTIEVRHVVMMAVANALWTENDRVMEEAMAEGRTIVRCGHCGTRYLPAAKCPWCLIDVKSYAGNGPANGS